MDIETRAKTPEQMEKLFTDIKELKINPEHPRYNEYLNLSKDASDIFYSAMRAFNMPDDWQKFTDAFDQLKELYARAMEIRASMLPSSIAKAIEVQSGDTIESTLTRLIDPIKETRLIPSDAKKLEDMARGLAVDPADLLSGGNIQGNRYYDKANSEIFVRLGTVAKDKELIAELRRNVLPGVPELEPILKKLEDGLAQLEAYNPGRTQMFNWAMNFKDTMHHMDTRPLRLMFALGGALLSGVGLATNLITGSPVTWPTFAWAGVAAYSMFPDFMAGNGGEERAFIAQFTKPEMKELMKHLNVKAFEELQDARGNPARKKLIAQLSTSSESLSPAQIGALTSGQNTPLATALSALNAKGMAQAALQTFARSFTKGETEALGVLMKKA